MLLNRKLVASQLARSSGELYSVAMKVFTKVISAPLTTWEHTLYKVMYIYTCRANWSPRGKNSSLCKLVNPFNFIFPM